MADPDDWLDPDFRGPLPTPCEGGRCPPRINNRPELLQSQAQQLAALANRRIRFAHMGIGRQIYEIQQRAKAAAGLGAEFLSRTELELLRRAEVNRQMLALHALDYDTDKATQAELRRRQLAANERARREQEKAQAKSSKAAVARDLRARAALHVPGGSVAADALLEATVLLVEPKWRSAVERQRTGRATNRTGSAAAPRPVRATSRTNRTGAAATRAAPVPAAVDATNPAARKRAVTAASAKGLGHTGSNPVKGVVSEKLSGSGNTRAGSRTVSSSRTTSRSLPTQSPVSVRFGFGTPPADILQALLPVRRLARAQARAPTRAPASAREVAALSAPGLTAINSPLLASGSSRCDCPPKSPKKPKADRCTNPVVSTKRKGDLIITTRRQTCPPSKPK